MTKILPPPDRLTTTELTRLLKANPNKLAEVWPKLTPDQCREAWEIYGSLRRRYDVGC